MKKALSVVVFMSVLIIIVEYTSPVNAIPLFARQYDVACNMCHLVSPKLNEIGEEFLANGYRFSDAPEETIQTIPFTVLFQGRYEDKISKDVDRAYFRELEIIAAGPIGKKGATYFIEWLPYNEKLNSDGSMKNISGRFEDVFVSFPLSDKNTITLGQFRASSQVDVSRRLSISTPLPFGAKVGSFAISSRSPSIGISHFEPEEEGDVVDGWTSSIVVPFDGELTLNTDFSLKSTTEGVFLETYKREGLNSFGGYMFLGEDQVLSGIIGVKRVNDIFYTGNLGYSTGDDDFRFSFEPEFLFSDHAAAGVRFEMQTGSADKKAGSFWLDFDLPSTSYTTRLRIEYYKESGNDSFILQVDSWF